MAKLSLKCWPSLQLTWTLTVSGVRDASGGEMHDTTPPLTSKAWTAVDPNLQTTASHFGGNVPLISTKVPPRRGPNSGSIEVRETSARMVTVAPFFDTNCPGPPFTTLTMTMPGGIRGVRHCTTRDEMKRAGTFTESKRHANSPELTKRSPTTRTLVPPLDPIRFGSIDFTRGIE